MRTIVTGGAGFIGSHLTEALVARGFDVACLEHPAASRAWLVNEPIEWLPIGLDDQDRLTAALRGADTVFHLAGLTQARSAGEFYSVNTEGTANLLAAAAAQKTPPRLIFLSSLAALGPCRNGDLLSRHTVPYPLSHYGMSKLLAEAVVLSRADRVPVTVLRLASVYGPRERAVLKLFQLVRRGIALTVGGWDREVSLVYVKDVVAAMIAAARSEQTVGRTYCVAHPQPIRWSQFASEVGKVVGRRPLLISVPRGLAWHIAWVSELCARVRRSAAILNRERVREIAQERWVCDSGGIMADAGFRPAYPVERGVPETAAWYRKEGWL